MDCRRLGSSVSGIDFPGENTGEGFPFPSPGDLPDPGIETASPALAGGFFTTEPSGKPHKTLCISVHVLKKFNLLKDLWG